MFQVLSSILMACISLENIKFSLKTGYWTVGFTTSVLGQNLNIGFECLNCQFVGSGSGNGIKLWDAYKQDKVALNMSLKNCTFMNMKQAILIRDAEHDPKTHVALRVGLPCIVIISNCSFSSVTSGVIVGSKVNALIETCFFKARVLHFQADAYSRLSVQNSWILGPAEVSFVNSDANVSNSVFDGIDLLTFLWQGSFAFINCTVRNANSASGLIYVDSGAILTLNCTFFNVTFFNTTT
jgi:hypothetical protein